MVSPNGKPTSTTPTPLKERRSWASQTARSLGIKGNMRLLLDYIVYRAQDGSFRGPWARQDRVATELDIPLRTLQDNLKRLRALGAVSTRRTQSGPLTFTVDYGSVPQLSYVENSASVAKASPAPSKKLATELAGVSRSMSVPQVSRPSSASSVGQSRKIRSYSLDRLQTNKEEEKKTTPLPSEDLPSQAADQGQDQGQGSGQEGEFSLDNLVVSSPVKNGKGAPPGKEKVMKMKPPCQVCFDREANREVDGVWVCELCIGSSASGAPVTAPSIAPNRCTCGRPSEEGGVCFDCGVKAIMKKKGSWTHEAAAFKHYREVPQDYAKQLKESIG